MQTVRQDKILDEVARGSSLDRVLTMIAGQIAAEVGAPTCKIWVVMRGDICGRCPLAAVCTNRQMCMHLAAASGAALDREYPRIPLSIFSAGLIARGGASDFVDEAGAGGRLFGLQHGVSSESRDSYALYPLRGASGTVGLIGIFNHRPIEQSEIEAMARLAPAAVAAIRVAELQSRCDSLRARLETEAGQKETLEQASASRTQELEDGVAQLTRQVAQLRVERDSLMRTNEEVDRSNTRLRDENRQLLDRMDSLIVAYQDGGRLYSEKSAQLEADRHRIEEENVWLKGQLASFEQSLAELNKSRDALTDQLSERDRSAETLKADLAARQADLAAAREDLSKLEETVSQLERDNVGLAGDRAALTQNIEDLEYSLRIAEDARARMEQASVQFEEKVAEMTEQIERLRLDHGCVTGENEQLVTEMERLRGEISEGEQTLARLGGDNERLSALNREIAQARTHHESRAASLEQENAELAEVNAQLEEALRNFESLAARLEDTAVKLRDRAEASERWRADLEQRNRTLGEQNRRLALEGQDRARFLAGMTHELRTPMNSIIGFTSLLLEDRELQLSERHRRSLERVSRNARNLLELINNVLDFSKIEAGRMDVYSEPTDLVDLIERAIAVVEPMKDARSLALSLVVEDDLPALRTDRTKLQQILINLLTNAIKYTQEGEVKIMAARAGQGRIRISVSDTGVGISEMDLPKLFEEFRQVGAGVRGAGSGTGLGLAITRRLIEMLGGEITVSSLVGEGSVFSVMLPLEIEGRVAPGAEADPTVAYPERTALVIDGDPASLYLIKKYLGERGYSVAATDDALRGAEIARMASPAIITVDLDLGDDALALIEQLTGGEKTSIVIAVSAEAENEQRAISAGADLFLRKPVERAELLDRLERILHPCLGQVVVVDDDPDALDLAVAILDKAGYEVRTASDGREALDEIARARPDAIILDLMLPEVDGFEVAHRLSLNADWRDIPVIMLTACDLSHEERRALDISTVRIFQKGAFSRDELLAELSLVISKKSEGAIA